MQYTLQKIKEWFFSNLTKKRVLISIFLLLIIPLISDAMIGVDITGIFSTMLEGISETAIPFKLFFVFLLLALLISKVFLSGAAWLLEWVANPAHLEIMESELVQIGWQFTSSLANTAIIIILIIIGIATILNKESYGAKKALPKLIIVALLVNFSLVFVGMVVDISNIILMTFFKADIVEKIINALSRSWSSIATSMSAYLAASLIAFSIPFSAPFAQIAFITSMTGMFLPQLIDAVMQIITTLLLGGTLLSYGILFLARIFVIQILAIFSPLAFVARVLPKTKNLWDEWLKSLVEWALLGVVLFFFLSLTTIAVEPLRPEEPISALSGPFSGQIATLFIYYIALTVFLIVSLKISRKYMPQGAQAVIDGIKKAKDGLQSVAAPMTKPLRRSITEEATTDKIEERQRRLDENDFDDGLTGVAQKANTKINQTIGKFARRSSMSKYGGVKSPESKMKDYDNSEFTDNATEEELKAEVKKKGISDSRRMQSIEKLAEEGNIEDEEIKNIITDNWEKINKDIQKDLKKARPDIHLDLADNMEEGMENMINEINKMKPSETKDIKLNDMDYQVRNVAASALAQDGAVVQSWGDSSRSKKQLLIDSLEGSSEEVMQSFENNVSKNIDKWNGLYETSENSSSNSNSSFDPNATNLTDEDKQNFRNNT